MVSDDEFDRVHKNIESKRIPTISLNQYQEYAADVDNKINLKREKGRRFVLTRNDLTQTYYRLCETCTATSFKVSFLNREDGQIYFLDTNCYLEVENKEES